MAFEPQNVYKARKMYLSAQKQAAYGAASVLADGKFTINLPFDGGIFATMDKGYYSDMDLVGKGDKFPRVRQKIRETIEIPGSMPVSDVLAGWLFAWLMQSDVITGAGPYTHTFDFLSATNQAVPTGVYFEDTADIKFKICDCALAEITISGGPSGPLQATFKILSTGVFVDGADAAPPALSAYTLLLGSDTDILIGPSGAPVSIKERVEASWQVKIYQELVRNDAPGGGMFGTFLKIGNQRAVWDISAQAKDVDDLRTLFRNDTLRELQINTNSGAAAQLNMKFPNTYVKAQANRSGDQVVWKLSGGEQEVVRVGATAIFTPVVINSQATAYLLP